MAIDNYTPEQIEEILQAFFEVAGTRQYIGARYVPIFGRGRGTPIEWDNSDAYEPLSIVYYMGDTYTSRRYVPAQIPIDDQDYWVITGRYNAQVEQYRQEVLGFSGRIDGAYAAVDALRDDVATDYVPFPDPDHYPKYGTLAQVLTTLADGGTKWDDPVTVDAAIAGPLIDAWLDDHPEATTTVQDNSVTDAKLFQRGIKGNAIHFGPNTFVYDATTATATFSGSVDNAKVNTAYYVNATAEVVAALTNSPFTSGRYMLFNLAAGQHDYDSTDDGTLNTLQLAISYTTHDVKMRSNLGGTWSAWEFVTPSIPDNSVTDAKLFQRGIKGNAIHFGPSTFAYDGTSATAAFSGSIDNAKVNTAYYVNAANAEVRSSTTNLPFTSGQFMLFCLTPGQQDYDAYQVNNTLQLAISYTTHEVMMRNRINGSWADWSYVVSDLLTTNNMPTGYIRGFASITTGELLMSYPYRIVKNHINHTDVTRVIRSDTGYVFRVYLYADDGTFISATDNLSHYVIEAGSNYRIGVSASPEDTSTPANVATMSSKVHISADAMLHYPLAAMPSYMRNAMAYRPLGNLSKGYVCFSCDDGRSELATQTIPIFETHNVPLSMCLWSTSEVITNASHLATVIDAVTNHGMEVAQHGPYPWANGILMDTPYDEKGLTDFLESERVAFAAVGITVARAAACPYGYVDARSMAQVGGLFGVQRSVYDYGDEYNVVYPYYCSGPRSNLFTLRAFNVKNNTYAYIESLLDYAKANNMVANIYFHDFDMEGLDADNHSGWDHLEHAITYAQTISLDFCKLSEIPYLV